MTHAAYRAALTTIASIEAEGEDAGPAIASLSRSTGIDPATLRQEVTEQADLLA